MIGTGPPPPSRPSNDPPPSPPLRHPPLRPNRPSASSLRPPDLSQFCPPSVRSGHVAPPRRSDGGITHQGGRRGACRQNGGYTHQPGGGILSGHRWGNLGGRQGPSCSERRPVCSSFAKMARHCSQTLFGRRFGICVVKSDCINRIPAMSLAFITSDIISLRRLFCAGTDRRKTLRLACQPCLHSLGISACAVPIGICRQGLSLWLRLCGVSKLDGGERRDCRNESRASIATLLHAAPYHSAAAQS
jgi:hypothetical protein